MKLSDLGDIQKLAEEFKTLRKFEMFLEGRDINQIKIVVSDTHNIETTLTLSNRNTITSEVVVADIEPVIRKHREILQTKLAMVGVDDFEELAPKK